MVTESSKCMRAVMFPEFALTNAEACTDLAVAGTHAARNEKTYPSAGGISAMTKSMDSYYYY